MVEKHEGGPPLTGYHHDSSHATRNSTRHAALALALWRTRAHLADDGYLGLHHRHRPNNRYHLHRQERRWLNRDKRQFRIQLTQGPAGLGLEVYHPSKAGV